MSKSAALAAALLVAAGCTPLTTGAIDGIATGSIGLPTPMATYGDALAPPAFYDFCFRFPRLCGTSGSKAPSTLSPDAERQLQRVNASVNAAVREVPDALSEGGEDVWMPATAVGDCEDIAILKKQRLLDLGWPASSLLLTVVSEPGSEEGHTLLTVRTDRGDLVLDNLTDGIRQWWNTPYRYYARQAVGGTGRWEFIAEDTSGWKARL